MLPFASKFFAAVLFTACEDDPILEPGETDTSTGGGSYGQMMMLDSLSQEDYELLEANPMIR